MVGEDGSTTDEWDGEKTEHLERGREGGRGRAREVGQERAREGASVGLPPGHNRNPVLILNDNALLEAGWWRRGKVGG